MPMKFIPEDPLDFFYKMSRAFGSLATVALVIFTILGKH